MSVRARFRALSPAARLLVVNQFGINVGFYMVVPFLATYLVDRLGYAAAVVGAVLGVRTLAQQGLFLVGGTAADRLGCRPVIVLGCALRVLAFGLFAVSTVTGIVLYVRVAAWAGSRWPPGTCVAAGVALMGAGFVPVAIAAPLLPTATGLTPAAALCYGNSLSTSRMRRSSRAEFTLCVAVRARLIVLWAASNIPARA